MTAALETDEVCKPATAGETTARKLHEKQAEINKRILAAMASSDDNQDVWSSSLWRLPRWRTTCLR